MFNSFLLEYSKLGSRWDIKWYIGMLESIFPMEKLGKHIKERSEKMKLSNFPNEVFSILWVNNKVGVVDAYDELWKNINQSYKKVQTNDITYNPYRVNVGSVWIVKEWLKWKYISPAYVVFYCDEKHIMTEYLHLILSSNWFNDTLRAGTSGSVRQNLTFDLLSSLEIPIPPLDIQKKIVETYNDIKNEIDNLENENKNLEKEVDIYLMKELWIEIGQKEKKKFFCVGYKDFERWSVDSNIFNFNDLNWDYRLEKVWKVLKFTQYWLSETSNTDWVWIPFLRMNNIINWELDYSNIKHFDLDIYKKKSYLLEKWDILFNRTNSKELVWKCAVFNEDWNYTFASYLIKVKVNDDLILPNYFTLLLNSKLWRKQIDSISRQITWQVNINAEELKNFIIQLPSLEIQKRILIWVKEIKNKNEINQKRINTLKIDSDQKIKAMILDGKYL